MPEQRISIAAFANQFLSGEAREAVVESAPNVESRTALFSFDQPKFDELIQLRVFEIDQGVTVSAPFGAVGSVVRLSGAGQSRRLEVSGQIRTERLRSRRG